MVNDAYCRFGWAFGFWLVLISSAAAQSPTGDPGVTIIGGMDDSGQWFRWTVRNSTSNPIMRIEFPQHRGDGFEPPPGWRFDWNNPNPNADGWVDTRTDNPAAAVRPGTELRFALRVPRGGVNTGRGPARVHFADGSIATVPDVESSRAPTAAERYSTMIGFGVIFLVILVVGLRRKSRGQVENVAPND